MTTKTNSELMSKVAAGIITTVFAVMLSLIIASFTGKASKSELKDHEEKNKVTENAIYWQIQEQRSGNNEKWAKQNAVNDKFGDKLDTIIKMLNEISGDNKAIKVEIKYLSGANKKALSLIDDSMFDK